MQYLFANASAAANAMHSVVQPLVDSLTILAGLVCGGFIISAGLTYITSSGQPDKLAHAKKILRDASLGLVLVLAAAVLTAILSHAYGSPIAGPAGHLLNLTTIQPAHTSLSLVDVLIKAITGVLANIVQTIGQPFIKALQYFTNSTPLMAENSSVFSLWLITVGIADSLFILVVCLVGFHVMSATSLGLDELDIKHLLPQLALVFLLINSSIFAIDIIIALSNGMISALRAGFGNVSVWQVLADVSSNTGGWGLAALVIMIIFLALAFILLVYYVGRLVTLYLGAVLAPILLLLWLLPSFKDFAANAARTYITTIFVLFVHVVILMLAASILAGLVIASPDQKPDPIMSLIVGLSTLVALIKTQGVLSQLSYASIGPKSIRHLSSQFARSLSASAVNLRVAKG